MLAPYKPNSRNVTLGEILQTSRDFYLLELSSTAKVSDIFTVKTCLVCFLCLGAVTAQAVPHVFMAAAARRHTDGYGCQFKPGRRRLGLTMLQHEYCGELCQSALF